MVIQYLAIAIRQASRRYGLVRLVSVRFAWTVDDNHGYLYAYDSHGLCL